MTTKKIGEIGGMWHLLFKVLLIMLPLGLSGHAWWVWWCTDEIYTLKADAQKKEELTIQIEHNTQAIQKNALAIQANTRLILEQLANGPSDTWRDRVKQLETDMRQNFVDHTEIKISLEQIKTAVGVKDDQSSYNKHG